MYTEKEFANCAFNPMTKGRITRNYPKLVDILKPEDRTQPHIDRLLKYIIALYDPQSPLIYQEKELKFRKIAAAEVAEFNDEIDAELLSKMYEGKDELTVRVTILYLKKFVKNRTWAMIQSAEAAFWTATEKLMTSVSETKFDASAQLDIQDKTHERLDKLYLDFYGNDIDLMRADLDQDISPEKVAKMKREYV